MIENFDVQKDSNNKTLIYTSDDGSNSIQYKEVNIKNRFDEITEKHICVH